MSKRKTTKKYANRLLGKIKEPEVVEHELSMIELAKILNFYNDNGDNKKLKKELNDYAVKKGFNINHLHESKCKTYGVLAKCLRRGFKLSTDTIHKLDVYIAKHSKKTKKVKPAVKKEPEKKSVKAIRQEYCLEKIDLLIDSFIIDNGFTYEIETKKSEINKVVNYIKTQLNQLKIDFDERCLSKSLYNKIAKRLNELLGIYQKIKSTTIRKKKVDKHTIVKTVKCDLTKHDYISKVIRPIDILGKKKMFCYDSKKNKLMIFHATSSGFTFKGTTLKNVDIEKSVCKSLPKSISLKQSMVELNRIYKSIGYKESKPQERFNDNVIILTVS